MDYAQLKTELTADPNGYGYANMDDYDRADALNLPRAAFPLSRGILPADQFYGDMVQYGLTVAAALMPENTPTPQGVPPQYPAAAVKQLVMDVWKMQIVNTDSPSTQALMGIAVAYGLISQDIAAGLLTRQGSRAEKLFDAGVTVTALDVARAMRGETVE